jgi:hypothetical protein
MDDAVAAGDHGVHGFTVGKIALHELLVVSRRAKTYAICKPDRAGKHGELCAHDSAELARCSSDEKAFHDTAFP